MGIDTVRRNDVRELPYCPHKKRTPAIAFAFLVSIVGQIRATVHLHEVRISMAIKEEVYLTPEEAATMLRISTRTLRRWEKTGKIVGVRMTNKTVRYPRALIEGFARRAEQQSPQLNVVA
jgi:excisionase family DNA binding protein